MIGHGKDNGQAGLSGKMAFHDATKEDLADRIRRNEAKTANL